MELLSLEKEISVVDTKANVNLSIWTTERKVFSTTAELATVLNWLDPARSALLRYVKSDDT